jgi:hypothetical protein
VAVDKISKIDGVGMLAAGKRHDKVNPENFGSEEQQYTGNKQESSHLIGVF